MIYICLECGFEMDYFDEPGRDVNCPECEQEMYVE